MRRGLRLVGRRTECSVFVNFPSGWVAKTMTQSVIPSFSKQCSVISEGGEIRHVP